MDSIASDSTEEMEDDMSSLANGFATEMWKRDTSGQGETTPGSEVFDEKHSRWSGLDEEAQKISVIITVDSLE